MAENQNFFSGGTLFPLTASTANSLLRDADPFVFYCLEFIKSVITTHVGSRLLAEASAAGVTNLTSAVAETLPLDPEYFLTQEHIRFPLLSLYRVSSAHEAHTHKRKTTSQLKLCYVLPPLQGAQAERLLPVLHAVAQVVDRKIEQGLDPSYTPTSPAGTAGEFVWSNTRAGVARVSVDSASFGAYQISNELFFPAVTMSITQETLSAAYATDGQYQNFAGAQVDIAQQEFDGTQLEFVVEFDTDVAPTLTSLLPITGTSAGGTSVTLTGTGFKVNTRPLVFFGGAQADAVQVVNATTVTCVTPPHAAYPNFVADVSLVAADGQTATLADAFTFVST